MTHAATFLSRSQAVVRLCVLSGNPELVAWGETFATFFTGGSFEGAFGLAPGWRRAAAADLHPDLLAKIAEKHGHLRSVRKRAEAISTELRRYESTGWIHDRRRGRPNGRAGLFYDWLVAGIGTDSETIRKDPFWVNEQGAATQKTPDVQIRTTEATREIIAK